VDESENHGAIKENTRVESVIPHPNDKQYCPLLASPNQTSQEVTHPSTTLAEARLTAEF
jgi:hypothetical protein